jgi:hypothetical protein
MQNTTTTTQMQSTSTITQTSTSTNSGSVSASATEGPNATHAEFIGPPFSSWSDPAAWADGTVPQSSTGLDVQLDASSYANVGSQSSPFQTNDIIGASEGLFLGIGGPSPSIPGFLQAHDIQNVANVVLAGNAGLDVRNDLDNVGTLRFFEGGTAEIGNNIGSTTIEFQQFAGTLILDHPAQGSLDNQVLSDTLSTVVTHNIELGGIIFDHADLIPPLPGSTNGQVQLSNHGASVYTLTNVTGISSASFAGVDPTTGYDILSLSNNT